MIQRLLLLAAAVLPAQDVTFRVDVDLVTVPVQATRESDGQPARELTKDDFILVDNGAERPIENLWFETGLPLTIGIVVDVSGSQQERLARHRQTIIGFLRRVMRPDDRAFLVSADAYVKLMADMTGSVDVLARALEPGAVGKPLGDQCGQRLIQFPGDAGPTLISQCGGTALWNAVWSAAHWKLREVQGRKALLILSDGIDTGSTHSLPGTSGAVQRAQALVYAIQYPKQSLRSRGSVGLQRLAEESGGLRFLAPADGESYEPIFAQIEGDLRNQYVLGFRPAEGARGFRQIEIRARQAGLRVRARPGYFAGIP